MRKLFSFEYQPADTQDTELWTSRPQAFKTQGGAKGAALKWQTGMADEGCPVRVRVGELVDDGRNGWTLSALETIEAA
jgi:hypothetical protein